MMPRSEERRVGKEGRDRGWGGHSSRRRHTICLSDWSSDVCSSDLGSATPRWNEYLSVGNVRVGMRVKEVTTTTVSLRYFHTDHLGSISVITNESGVVVERLSYDA